MNTSDSLFGQTPRRHGCRRRRSTASRTTSARCSCGPRRRASGHGGRAPKGGFPWIPPDIGAGSRPPAWLAGRSIALLLASGHRHRRPAPRALPATHPRPRDERPDPGRRRADRDLRCRRHGPRASMAGCPPGRSTSSISHDGTRLGHGRVVGAHRHPDMDGSAASATLPGRRRRPRLAGLVAPMGASASFTWSRGRTSVIYIDAPTGSGVTRVGDDGRSRSTITVGLAARLVA